MFEFCQRLSGMTGDSLILRPGSVKVFPAALVLLLSALVLLLSATQAQTFAESTTSASCSLRNAIATVRSRSNTGGCTYTAHASVNTVNLGANEEFSGQYLDMNGWGALVIDGGASTRYTLSTPSARNDAFFEVRGNTNLTLKNLTLTGGRNAYAGGAINLYSSGGPRLTIENSVVHSNRGGGRGGAISMSGNSVVTISNSVFYGNSVSGSNDGGAIYTSSSGSLTIRRSAFYSNSSADTGGAIYANGNLTVENSTFYNNTGTNGGGGFSLAAALNRTINLRHVTITENIGGGIRTGASNARVVNSIIYGNSGNDCQQTTSLSGNSYNTIGTGNCGTGTGGSSANPLLPSSATDNRYFALPVNSPAVNAIPNANCLSGVTVDQAGNSRPFPGGGACDMGAYELQEAAATSTPGPPPTATPTPPPFVQVTTSSGCSLSNAITTVFNKQNIGGCTFSGASENTVTLHGNVSLSAARSLSSGSLTIKGAGHSITGPSSGRLFTLSGAMNLTLDNVTITGGDTGQFGGAISVGGSGSLTVTNSVFHGNTAGRSGGAIYAAGTTTLSISDSVFYSNRAISNASGGAVATGERATATIDRSVFYNNSATQIGGAVAGLSGSHLTITNSTFYSNTSTNFGGAIGYHGERFAARNGSMSVRYSTITGNSATQQGGGVLHRSSSFAHSSLIGSIVYGNTVGGSANDCETLGTVFNTLSYNIIGAPDTCGAGTNGASDDPLLPSSATTTGSLPYFAPPAGSPAVNAIPNADCISGVRVDQLGKSRPNPSRGACDIGAIEFQFPQASPDDDSQQDSAPRRPGETSTPTPTPRISTCLSLPVHIVVSNITQSTQCQQVGSGGIGNAEVLAAGFRDAVDVWGWILPNTQVCFAVPNGRFLFLDAATSPRAVSELSAVGIHDWTCTRIGRAGTVALMQGAPAPTATWPPPPTPTPPRQWRLSNCMVRTQYILNFRASPGGAIMDVLPYNVTLTALERTADWFLVDFHGARGWVSNGYLEAIGDCG